MRDQGHRKGGSFSVFPLFVCKPLFRRATLPNGGREQSRAVVDVEESVVEVSGDNVVGLEEMFDKGVGNEGTGDDRAVVDVEQSVDIVVDI